MKKIFITAGLLLLISGCSTRLLYPNLDWLIPFYLDDYISLDSEQDSRLDHELVALLGWHCQTQLPVYSTSLRALVQDLEKPVDSITSAQISIYAAEIEEHWDLLLSRLLPQAAGLLVSASDSQVDELLDNIAERNERFRKNYVAVHQAKILETRTSDMVKTLERWVEKLRIEQKQRVQQWSRQMRDVGAERLKHRNTLVDELSRIVVGRKTSNTYQQELVSLLSDLEATRSRKYIEMLQHNRKLTHQLLSDLYQTLDQKQRRRLRANIVSLAKDFEALACRASQPSQPALDSAL